MKINKKLIALLSVFTSNLIISADISADLEKLKLEKIANIEQTQINLDSQYKKLFDAKLAALGKRSLDNDLSKTTAFTSFLKKIIIFTPPEKTAFYKYLTNQDFSFSFLQNAFGEGFSTKVPPTQREGLDLFRQFLPINRDLEIQASFSSGNQAKETTLSSWSLAQKELIVQEDLHKAATDNFNDFVSKSLLPDYEKKTLKLLSDIEAAVDVNNVEKILQEIQEIQLKLLEIKKIVFSKFASKELNSRAEVAAGVQVNPFKNSVDVIINIPKELRNLLRILDEKIISAKASAITKLREVELALSEALEKNNEAKDKALLAKRLQMRADLNKEEEIAARLKAAQAAQESAEQVAKSKSLIEKTQEAAAQAKERFLRLFETKAQTQARETQRLAAEAQARGTQRPVERPVERPK